jgi:hypothetical protein
MLIDLFSFPPQLRKIQTRMAGIIAGQNVGVARSANIIPVKAGDNEHVSQMGIINGLNFALQHAQAHGGRGVISISVSMFKNQPDNMLQVVQSVSERMELCCKLTCKCVAGPCSWIAYRQFGGKWFNRPLCSANWE